MSKPIPKSVRCLYDLEGALLRASGAADMIRVFQDALCEDTYSQQIYSNAALEIYIHIHDLIDAALKTLYQGIDSARDERTKTPPSGTQAE